MIYEKRGPAADERKEVYFRLIRRFGFDRVFRHIELVKKAIPSQ